MVGRKQEVYQALDAQLPQAQGTRGLVLDQNCASFTEMAFRIRGYEQFFMDMALDPAGTEKLLDRILAYKLEYKDVSLHRLHLSTIEGRKSSSNMGVEIMQEKSLQAMCHFRLATMPAQVVAACPRAASLSK